MIKDVVKVILKVNPGVFEYVEVSVEFIDSFPLHRSSQDISHGIKYFFVAQIYKELFLKEQFNLLLCEVEPLLEYLRYYHINKLNCWKNL